MPKIALVRSFLGVAGKSSCTENDYVLVQSCMFFFLQGNFHSVFGDLYFAALNKLVYLMEWQYCNRKYTFHVRLIKWWTHPFDSTRRTKLSFVAQWDSGKRSSSTEVKISSNILSGTTSMSKSRNMACLYVPWSRANVIASAAYKQFSSLVERGKMRCENPQRPLGSYN